MTGIWIKLGDIVMGHRFGSMVGAAFFTFWIGQRFYYGYRPTFLWWLVTFQFILFVAAYVTRVPARRPAHGFMETVYPFLVAGMPFALDSYSFKPYGCMLGPWELVAALMFVGTGFIVAGVFFLRRSFSIMTEVRTPVYKGVYRLTRHPMYLGSMISAAGILLYNFSLLNMGIFICFCGAQVYRARREEAKIAAASVDYARYAARVGWLWRLGRRNMSTLT